MNKKKLFVLVVVPLSRRGGAGMFVLCSFLPLDFLFSPKLREVFLYFCSSPEVFPDGAAFSWLSPLAASGRMETGELDVGFHQGTVSLNRNLPQINRQTFAR